MLPLGPIHRVLAAIAVGCATISVSAVHIQGTQTGTDPAALRQQAQELEKSGRFGDAIPVAERAVALYESQRGPNDPALADYLLTLGRLRYATQDFDGAIAAFERELAIREKGVPPNNGALAVTLGNLANARRNRGQLVEAEALLRRALSLQEQVFGPGDVRLGGALTNLASLQAARGDIVAAEATFGRAVSIFEAQKQTETLPFAQLLNNLGQLHFQVSAFDKAIAPLERSLSIREKLNAPPADLARATASLAAVYQELGQFDRAEPLHRRVLQIYEAAPTPPQLSIASVSNNLAMIRSLSGDPTGAEPLFRRALELREGVLGPRHTDVARTLETMAVFYQSGNRPTEMLKAIERSSEILETNLRSILASGSEQQRLAYMTTVQENTDIALSLRQAALGQNTGAASWAASVVLRRKGRVLDAMATTMDRLGARVTPEERQQLDKLAAARSQLATLVLQPVEGKAGERDQRVRALGTEIDALESALASSSRDLAAELQAVNLTDIQKQLPADTVLVEYVKYRPFDPKVIGRANRFGAPRFALFALRQTGAPVWAELGPADVIEGRVAALRTALRSTGGPDPRPAARELARLILDPVEPQLRGVRRVLVASDGELSVIPFAALRDTGGRFLIERVEVVNLASGRDLLRVAQRQPSRESAVIVANPNFDAGTGAVASPSFRALPATAEEAAALRALLPDARVVSADEATEAALKSVKGPRVLHVATHGFFLDAATLARPGAADSRGVGVAAGAAGADSTGRLALVRSGLALRGANHRSGGGTDDGLLTALEAASLDLRGTQLVVLSACETGLGEVRSGDGVHGLRRALTMAGAEGQVMSLWPVNDQATRDLMVSFYKRLAARDGRAAALRAVQLELLKSPQRSHPFYWAAFVAAGDWTPLRTQ